MNPIGPVHYADGRGLVRGFATLKPGHRISAPDGAEGECDTLCGQDKLFFESGEGTAYFLEFDSPSDCWVVYNTLTKEDYIAMCKEGERPGDEEAEHGE